MAIFVMENEMLRITVCEIGASVMKLEVHIQNEWKDVVIGFDEEERYLQSSNCFGATLGRYANRIKGASFTLNGNTYQLEKNNYGNTLHGGSNGFHHQRFSGKQISKEMVEFTYLSKHMEQKFPGELLLLVRYYIKENRFYIEYETSSSEDTICNISNHMYFNLNGHDSGSVLSHEIKSNADCIVMIDQEQMATDQYLKVEDTPFDFLQRRTIGSQINAAHEQIINGYGYDHYFLSQQEEKAMVFGDSLKLSLATSYPGFQFYVANLEPATVGKEHAFYQGRCSFCLEPSYQPDDIHTKQNPDSILRSNELKTEWICFTLEALPAFEK